MFNSNQPTMNETQKKQSVSELDRNVDEILSIILNGRSEQEAVFLTHIIVKEVDKFFDHLAEAQDVRAN